MNDYDDDEPTAGRPHRRPGRAGGSGMTTLRDATPAELEAELRRRRIPYLPAELDVIDCEGVIAAVRDYSDFVNTDDSYHKDNTHHYKTAIFVAAVEAVYGEEFWEWCRRRRP